MNRETYYKILARKIGYEHLIGMDVEEAKKLLESDGKETTIAPWNQREQYMEDGVFVENQINLISKDNKVWAVFPSYDNAVI